jgi:hypothetical protein
MCKAASFIVNREYKVFFHPTQDSHQQIIDYHKLHEGNNRINFVPVEITPPNNNLSLPFKKWEFATDLTETPDWYDATRAEKAVRAELPEWFKKLDGVRLQEAFKPINPFKIRAKKLSKKHKLALKEWNSVENSVGGSVRNSVGNSVGDSVRGSVRNSVGDSVGDSVRDSVWNSVGDSVRDSVRDSVWNSVWNSVWGYTGSLFPNIKKWKYTDKDNPWNCIRTLWLDGYVPSYDGKVWKLHAGKKAKVVFEISKEDLKKIS